VVEEEAEDWREEARGITEKSTWRIVKKNTTCDGSATPLTVCCRLGMTPSGCTMPYYPLTTTTTTITMRGIKTSHPQCPTNTNQTE